MNQCSMTVDSQNHPIVAMWWAPGHTSSPVNDTRQYMLLYNDGTQWLTSRISNRPTESMQDDGDVREMGRPVVLCDQDDRTLVVIRYRDAGDMTPNLNHVKVAYSTNKQNWSFAELSTADSGDYEPIADPVRWQRDGILDLFYEPDNNSNSLVSVLEWNALRFTRGAITVDWAGGNSLWSTASKWTNNVLTPDGKWTTVRFANQSNADEVVNMSSTGRTVGNISFTSTAHSTTIQGSAGASLTMDNEGSDATITVAGAHTITVPVLLNSNLDISGGGTLNLSGGISGSYNLDVLSGNLTAATMQVGTLTLGAGATVTIQALPGGPQGGDLTPVPEPSTLVMLAVGAMLALGYSRLRR